MEVLGVDKSRENGLNRAQAAARIVDSVYVCLELIWPSAFFGEGEVQPNLSKPPHPASYTLSLNTT